MNTIVYTSIAGQGTVPATQILPEFNKAAQHATIAVSIDETQQLDPMHIIPPTGMGLRFCNAISSDQHAGHTSVYKNWYSSISYMNTPWNEVPSDLVWWPEKGERTWYHAGDVDGGKVYCSANGYYSGACVFCLELDLSGMIETLLDWYAGHDGVLYMQSRFDDDGGNVHDWGAYGEVLLNTPPGAPGDVSLY